MSSLDLKMAGLDPAREISVTTQELADAMQHTANVNQWLGIGVGVIYGVLGAWIYHAYKEFKETE